MSQQQVSDRREMSDTAEGSRSAEEEQFISGFCASPSDHSFDISSLVKSDRSLSFAPFADERYGESVTDVKQLLGDMNERNRPLAKNCHSSVGSGSAALTAALDLQLQLLKDPNISPQAKLNCSILKLENRLFSLLDQNCGEELISQFMQAQDQVLRILGDGTAVAPPAISPELAPLPLCTTQALGMVNTVGFFH